MLASRNICPRILIQSYISSVSCKTNTRVGKFQIWEILVSINLNTLARVCSSFRETSLFEMFSHFVKLVYLRTKTLDGLDRQDVPTCLSYPSNFLRLKLTCLTRWEKEALFDRLKQWLLKVTLVWFRKQNPPIISTTYHQFFFTSSLFF